MRPADDDGGARRATGRRRVLLGVVLVVAVGCGGGPSPSVSPSMTPARSSALPSSASPAASASASPGPAASGACCLITFLASCPPDPTVTLADAFDHVPFTLDLPPDWRTLPASCYSGPNAFSDLMVVFDTAEQQPARLELWNPANPDAPKGREATYSAIEKRAMAPSPGIAEQATKRIRTAVGEVLVVRYVANDAGNQKTALQYLSYTAWIDGAAYVYSFLTTPERFPALDPGFEAIGGSIRLKAAASPSAT